MWPALTRRAACLIAVALLLPCWSLRATAADDPALAVRQVVLDIVSFTRWPGPQPEHRLCIVGQPLYASGFFDGPMQAGGVPVSPQRLAANDERLGSACDVVFAGPLLPPERQGLMRRIEGVPVLVVGELAPGCIETTMFCLSINGAQVTFASNLDAIARSGVRLNPRVLMLGRRPATSGTP